MKCLLLVIFGFTVVVVLVDVNVDLNFVDRLILFSLVCFIVMFIIKVQRYR